MLKKTKDAASELADVIKKALNYNANMVDGDSPIKMTSIEISRGLMNHINRKPQEFMGDVYAELLMAYGEGFEWKTQDNEDMGCFLFITYR